MVRLRAVGSGRLPWRGVLGVGSVILVLFLLASPRPAGAVTIGSDLSVNAGADLGVCPCTFAPSGAPGYTIPSDGVLTKWRFKNFSVNDLAGVGFKLVVLQGNKVVAVDAQTLPSKPGFQQNVYEFTANIPVQAGERIGLESPGSFAVFGVPTNASASVDEWSPPLGLNESGNPTAANVNNQHELLLNADIGAPSPPSSGGGAPGGAGGGGGGAPTTAPPSGDNSGGGTGTTVLLNGGPSPTVLTSNPGHFTAPATCELPPGSPFTCSGSVVLRSVTGPARASATGGAVVLARAAFTIAPGQTKRITVKLKAKAQAALKKTGKLKGTLTTTSTLIDGTTSTAKQQLTVKLKTPKHH